MADDFISPFGNAEWYVIHTYPGYERKVQQNLLKRIKDEKLEDRVFQVVVLTDRQAHLEENSVSSVSPWCFSVG